MAKSVFGEIVKWHLQVGARHGKSLQPNCAQTASGRQPRPDLAIPHRACPLRISCQFYSPNTLHYDFDDPHNLTNDRLIFSKGHAAPLLYSVYKAAGAITDAELLTLRKFGSRIEGHPTPFYRG